MTELIYSHDHHSLVIEASYPASHTSRWGARLVVLSCAIWLGGFVVGFQVALSILTTLAFGLAVVGILRPNLGLLGVAMLCTLDAVVRPFLLTGGWFRWNTFNYLLLFVTVLGVPLLVSRRDLHSRLAMIFAALLVVQLHFASQWQIGAQHILNFAAVFGLLVYFVRAKHDPEVWYWQGLVCGVIAAAGGLLFFIQRDSLTYINTNALAHFPVAAIFAACIASLFAESTKRRIPLLLLTSINSCWVFLTGSRGAMLIAAGGLLYLLVQNRAQSRFLALFLTAGALAIGTLTQFSDLQDNALGRVQRLLDSDYSIAARTSGRSALAIDAWTIFRGHPFGVGTGDFGNVRAELSNRSTRQSFRKGMAMQSHSGWCQTLAENGIPGILLLAAFIGSFSLVAWRHRDRRLFLFGLLVTVAVSAALISTEFQGKCLWFLVAAAAVILNDSIIPRVEQFDDTPYEEELDFS